MKTIDIKTLAEKLNGTYWEKDNLKRIYLNDAGWNTKKMSTKTFIFQDENGDFKVSCKVECPSQPYQWCESQEKEVKDGVYSSLEKLLWEIENPEGDYYDYCEEQQAKKEAEMAELAKNKEPDSSRINRLLTARYLWMQKRPNDYLFETIEEYFSKTAHTESELLGCRLAKRKNLKITESKYVIELLDYCGRHTEKVEIVLPVKIIDTSKKYDYYSYDCNLQKVLPQEVIAAWQKCKIQTAKLNQLLDDKIAEILNGDDIKESWKYYTDKMYNDKNRAIYQEIKLKVDEL